MILRASLCVCCMLCSSHGTGRHASQCALCSQSYPEFRPARYMLDRNVDRSCDAEPSVSEFSIMEEKLLDIFYQQKSLY